MKLNKTAILNSFLYSALWTEELDIKYMIEDFLPSSVNKAKYIVECFFDRVPEAALNTYVEHFKVDTEDQLGHDIWLSINGHGAGFFDHPLGGAEDILQDVCRDMRDKGGKPGYINQVWVNEEGKILIE